MNASPVLITLLAKLMAAEAKEARSKLDPGEYSVDESVTLTATGSVKVGEDYTQRVVARAKPWNLVHVLLVELNKERAAAGKAGIDMKALIRMAETVDPDLVRKAQDAADSEIGHLKAATSKNCKGKVTCKGTLS